MHTSNELGHSDPPGKKTSISSSTTSYWSRLLAADDVYPGASEAVTIEEAEALVKYVAEQGLDANTSYTGPLLKAITDFRTDVDVQRQIVHYHDVFKHYSALTGQDFVPKGVNGRTILDTESLFFKTFWIIGLGLLLFAFGILTEVLGVYFEGITDPANMTPEEMYFFNLYYYGGRFISPFFWGGVGACVYLAKSLADYAADQSFDSHRLHGHRTRIFLGAVFAVVVVEIFQLRAPAGGAGAENLTPNAIAFLCGLGVKAVYAAFEKLVEMTSQRIKRIGTEEQQQPVPAAKPPQEKERKESHDLPDSAEGDQKP